MGDHLMQVVPVMRRHARAPAHVDGRVFVAAAAALILGPAVAWRPDLAAATILATVVACAAYVSPAGGAYILVFLTPLIAGMNRGAVLPLLRPSEALTVLVGAAVFTRRIADARAGRPIRSGPIRTTDASILFLVATGSVMPFLWLLARHRPLTQDDALYTFQIARYCTVYLVVRTAIREESEVRRCLVLCVVAGVIVALIAILQALKLFGVPDLLKAYFAPNGHTEALVNSRGSSTLAHPFAMADLAVSNVAIVGAWLARGHPRRGLLATAGLVLMMGSVASGEFSGALALVVGLVALGVVTEQLKRTALALIVAALLAGVALQPVIATRVNGFSSPAGVPSSWIGRLNNLETFVWPQVFHNFNYVLGVRPSARIEIGHGRTADVVYIESGYTWLLWVGGIPLLLAFLAFLSANLRATRRVARNRAGPVGVAATAGFVALLVLTVLTAFDAHLTLRGSGDLLFSLLALGYTGLDGSSDQGAGQPEVEGSDLAVATVS